MFSTLIFHSNWTKKNAMFSLISPPLCFQQLECRMLVRLIRRKTQNPNPLWKNSEYQRTLPDPLYVLAKASLTAFTRSQCQVWMFPIYLLRLILQIQNLILQEIDKHRLSVNLCIYYILLFNYQIYLICIFYKHLSESLVIYPHCPQNVQL